MSAIWVINVNGRLSAYAYFTDEQEARNVVEKFADGRPLRVSKLVPYSPCPTSTEASHGQPNCS